jgi:hypothetical protein
VSDRRRYRKEEPMNRRWQLVVASAVLCAASAFGCGWMNVKHGPNPLSGRHVWAVQQVSYQNLLVGNKPQEQYEAEKKDKSVDAFETDKAESATLFASELSEKLTNAGLQVAGGPGPEVVSVIPHVVQYEPGTYNGFFNKDTYVTMQVQMVDAAGQTLATEQYRVVVPASLGNPSSGGRFRSAMKQLGDMLGKFVVRRVNSPP